MNSHPPATATIAADGVDASGRDPEVLTPRLETWMDDQGLGRGPITDVVALAGGTQNMMRRFVRSDRTYVLRRGPRHLRPHSNSTIIREMRLLKALRETDVPHPGFIAGCQDLDVLDGAAFYLMEAVDGFNASLEVPAFHRNTPGVVTAMGEAQVDALARLGQVNHVEIGLADFGRPDGFLQRQVARWLEELQTYHLLAPGSVLLDGVNDVAAWLEERVPQDWQPGIMHGDYQVANVMFAHDSADIAAIVDWEMATIGDPLLDLGWMLAMWPDRRGEPDLTRSALSAAGILPDVDEVVERYATQSQRDLTHIDWYRVLGAFKAAILFEGTHARAMAGLAPEEVGESLHRLAQAVLERGMSVMASAR